MTELPDSTPLRGIGFKLASVAVFMAMSSLIKATADDVPPGEAVFFRSFFAIPVILVWLYATHEFGAGLEHDRFMLKRSLSLRSSLRIRWG